jgi:hypothetical protein
MIEAGVRFEFARWIVGVYRVSADSHGFDWWRALLLDRGPFPW